MAMSSYISIAIAPLFLRDFTFTNILKYTEYINEVHECTNSYTNVLIKGQELFKDGFISDISFMVLDDRQHVTQDTQVTDVCDDTNDRSRPSDSDEGYSIKATVKAEMKKTVSYNVSCKILKNGKIMDGICQCPGGVSPACCKHIFCLLSAIEDYSRKELYCAPTEKLQSWHHPKVKKISPKKYKQAHQPNCTSSVNIDALKALPGTAPIFGVMSSPSPLLLTDHLFYARTVPLPAFVLSQARTYVPLNVSNFGLDCILKYHSEICKNLNELCELEKQTIGQNTDLWANERRKRITASQIYNIIHATNYIKCAEAILKEPKDLDHLKPIQLGRRLEPMIKNLLRGKFPKHIFRNTGLTVHPLYPFLAASPDGLLFNHDDPMLVELKVTFNPKHLELRQLCQERKGFCLEFIPNEKRCRLKRTHKYYYQIQCQLFCSNLTKCLFCLFFDFGEPLFIETIPIDLEFWEKNFLKLSDFYFSIYLPMFVNMSDKKE